MDQSIGPVKLQTQNDGGRLGLLSIGMDSGKYGEYTGVAVYCERCRKLLVVATVRPGEAYNMSIPTECPHCKTGLTMGVRIAK